MEMSCLVEICYSHFRFHLMTPRSPSCVLSLAIIHRNDSLGPEDNLKFVEEHLAARQLKSFIVTD